MSNVYEPTEQYLKQLQEWLKDRPQIIKDLFTKFPPHKLYLLKSSNHKVTVYSYAENNTLTVIVSGQYNFVAFDRKVFGIKPEDLEECDLPKDTDKLGTMFTEQEDIDSIIDNSRVLET